MIDRINKLNESLERSTESYLKLVKALSNLAKIIRLKTHNKRNPLKGKQIIKILNHRI